MARRKRGRDIDGVILLDKPLGLSSNHALQRVRRALDARKAGHTGSLDPLATGLLPICLGEATKLSSYLLGADKHYRVTASIGTETTTGDAEGEVAGVSNASMPQGRELMRLLASFAGEHEQVPPMYSALKVDGKPLYQYAREGRVVERQARLVSIHAIDLVDADAKRMTLDLAVSSGTYVRTLVEDIARAWGGCAHVAALRRTRVGALGDSEPMVALAQLESEAEDGYEATRRWLHPISALIADWPIAALDAEQVDRISHGQAVSGAWACHDHLFRVHGPDGALLGFGCCEKAGVLRPKRLFARQQPLAF